MSDDSQTPGLLGSHLSYAKGAATESIGNVTGSKEWQTAGKDLQTSAKEDMHAAQNMSTDPSQRSATTSLGNEGSLEKTIGSAIGCPGMEQQGEQKQTQAGK